MTTRSTPIEAYFLCATPRTGSSLLLGLLESTGVAGRPQAYFRAPDQELWAERWQLPRKAHDYNDFVTAALAAGRTPNGIFGAKLMWGTLDEVVGRLGVIHPDLAGRDLPLLERSFGRVRFVYLHREDVVAQAVSWLRAEQTNAWRLGGNGEIGDDRPNGREPQFDAVAIAELHDSIMEHNAAWESWFTAQEIEPYRLSYEELQSDMTATVNGVLDFLGLGRPPQELIAPRHRRQADSLNAQWAERFRAEG